MSFACKNCFAWRRKKRSSRPSSLASVGPIHRSNLASNRGPLELSPDRLAALLTLQFFPLEQFVRESQVGLNDHIEASRSDEAAAASVSTVRKCKKSAKQPTRLLEKTILA